jgi:hypothetical protein
MQAGTFGLSMKEMTWLFDWRREAPAVKRVPLSLWKKCRWAETFSLSLGFRSVYGVFIYEPASPAMIATSSRFRLAAKQFADSIKYQMSLKEYDDIAESLRSYV